jgi:hypothetical protein
MCSTQKHVAIRSRGNGKEGLGSYVRSLVVLPAQAWGSLIWRELRDRSCARVVWAAWWRLCRGRRDGPGGGHEDEARSGELRAPHPFAALSHASALCLFSNLP